MCALFAHVYYVRVIGTSFWTENLHGYCKLFLQCRTPALNHAKYLFTFDVLCIMYYVFILIWLAELISATEVVSVLHTLFHLLSLDRRAGTIDIVHITQAFLHIHDLVLSSACV